jgi:hypothetical protein
MFSTIQDPVDARITIVRDDATGFYNIPNALAQMMPIYNIKVKNVGIWLSLQSSKELIKTVCSEFNVDCPYYALHDTDTTENNGTYFHPVLYAACMSWATPKYYIKSINIALNQ